MTTHQTKDQKLAQLLQDNDILALVAIAGHLIESGHRKDVRPVLMLLHRYFVAHSPDLRPGDILDDEALSEHVEGQAGRLMAGIANVEDRPGRPAKTITQQPGKLLPEPAG
jgi:hypothetical protein